VEYLSPILGVYYLRVKLKSVKPPPVIPHCSNRRICRVSYNGKTIRQCIYLIPMAHPYDRTITYPLKDVSIVINGQLCLPIFPLQCLSNFSFKEVCHELHAVAYAEDRYIQIKYLVGTDRSALLIDA